MILYGYYSTHDRYMGLSNINQVYVYNYCIRKIGMKDSSVTSFLFFSGAHVRKELSLWVTQKSPLDIDRFKMP